MFVSVFATNFLHLPGDVVEIVEDDGIFGFGAIEDMDDLFHLFFECFDCFDFAAFERVDKGIQNEQVEIFGPNITFNFFEYCPKSINHTRTLNDRESTRLKFQGPELPVEMRI